MHDSTKYPVGIQDFGEIIRGGYVYVDKTALLWRLIDRGKYYFLSRPRRFGKSLLLSTIAAYFEGKRDLFQSLAIADKTGTWPDQPVLFLDWGNQKYARVEDLHERLNNRLCAWEDLYGRREVEISPSQRFEGVIQRACEQKGQVVILIDEYDKPLLDAAGDEALYEEFRGTLHAVYSNLKTCDRYIKFGLLTGVTKFSKLSIFSGLNNLNDISMDEAYATICGITAGELCTYFASGIKELARKNSISVQEAEKRLKRRYDGYQFEENAERVYNPFSLLNALSKKKFQDYWFATGTPKFLMAMLKRGNYNLQNITTDAIAPEKLNALDTLSGNPMPILYQSGYLTLAGVRPRTGYYTLRFPNEEVEHAFFQMLLPLYTKGEEEKPRTDTLLDQLITGLDEGRPEAFMQEVQALLADVPYEKGKAGELYFRNLLFIIVRLIGFYCEVEHALADGRSDMVIKTDQYIYVLELKVDQSAEAALRQIEDKGYAAPYATDRRRLFKIGVNFSSAEKKVSEWRVAVG